MGLVDGYIIILFSVLPALVCGLVFAIWIWQKIPRERKRFQIQLVELIFFVLCVALSMHSFWFNVFGMLAVTLTPLFIMGCLLGWVASRKASQKGLPSSWTAIGLMSAGVLFFTIFGMMLQLLGISIPA